VGVWYGVVEGAGTGVVLGNGVDEGAGIGSVGFGITFL
jgi:hypothetical protein